MEIVYFEDYAKEDARYGGYVRVDVESEIAHTVLLHKTGAYCVFSDPHEMAHLYGAGQEYPLEKIVALAKSRITQYDLPTSPYNEDIMAELCEKISSIYL